MSEPVKHTPGPWSVRWPDYEQAELLREEAEDADEDDYPGAYRAALDAACAVVSAPNWVDFARVVVVVSGAPDAGGEANARLIAAAPDLLAACEMLMGDVKGGILIQKTIDAARAAIAKAKGGAQ